MIDIKLNTTTYVCRLVSAYWYHTVCLDADRWMLSLQLLRGEQTESKILFDRKASSNQTGLSGRLHEGLGALGYVLPWDTWSSRWHR